MSIKLEPIAFEDLYPFVSLAFEGDIDLLRGYHISPGSLEHCVGNTMFVIEKNYEHFGPNIEFYAVTVDGIAVGFTVVIRSSESSYDELLSFGINIRHRKPNVVIGWLEEVKKKMGGGFYIVLWSKNTRAIDFFRRNGLIVDNSLLNPKDETKTLIICLQEELHQAV